jgi:RNA polymerase sigma factor (sigma-70 family)
MPHLSAVLARVLTRLPASAAADAELLRAYAADHDPDAFRALVARHGPLVLGVCRRVLGNGAGAEDAFQATFLVLARRAGTVRRPTALASWLFGVARRAALKARTADRRRGRRDARAATHRCTPAEPMDDLSARELLAALDEELARLPLVYREPLLLCYWQGLTQDQAGRRLSCSAGAVKGRLERGRARLAQRLTRRGFGPATLMLAPLAIAIVPRDLLARTAAWAASPWSATLPTAVLALAAGPSKLVPSVAIAILLSGVGVFVFAAGAGAPADAPKAAPPSAAAAGPALDRYGDSLPAGAIARLGSLRWRGTASRNLFDYWSYTPDGKAVITLRNTSLIVIDIDTGRELRRLTVPTRAGFFTDFAFAPDGRRLVTADVSGLRVWEWPTGRELAHVEVPSRHPIDLRTDGRYMAHRCYPFDRIDPIFIQDLTTGAEQGRVDGGTRERPVKPLGFIGDTGALVLVQREDKEMAVRVWSVSAGTDVRRWTLPTESDPRLTPDGRTLWASAPGGVQLWDTTTGQPRAVPEWMSRLSGRVTFTSDSKVGAAADAAGTMHWFDVATGRELGQMPWRDRRAQIRLSPDGRQLAAVFGFEDVIRRFDLASRRELSVPEGHSSAIGRLTFTPDGRTLFADTGFGVHAWDPATARERWRIPTGVHDGGGTLSVSADGREVVTVSFADKPTGTVRDALTGTPARSFPLPGKGYAVMAAAPDGPLMAVGYRNQPGVVHLLDADGRELRRIALDANVPLRLTVLPGGRLLAAADDGFAGVDTNQPLGPIRWYDTETGRAGFELADAHECLAASRDGRMILCRPTGTFFPCRYSLVETATGRERLRLSEGTMLEGTFSPDGRLVAGTEPFRGDSDRQAVVVWDAWSGAEVARLTGHAQGVRALAFAPDGRTLASAGHDCTVLIWDVAAVAARRPAAPASADLPALWNALADADAAAAHRAVGGLTAGGDRAVELIRTRLRPAAVVPADQIARLVADLDATAFADREKATTHLADLGERAGRALRQARAGGPSAEQKTRIDRLIAGLDGPPVHPGRLRAGRAVEVLEHIATPEARALLAALANGDPHVYLTREAKASLGRFPAQ